MTGCNTDTTPPNIDEQATHIYQTINPPKTRTPQGTTNQTHSCPPPKPPGASVSPQLPKGAGIKGGDFAATRPYGGDYNNLSSTFVTQPQTKVNKNLLTPHLYTKTARLPLAHINPHDQPGALQRPMGNHSPIARHKPPLANVTPVTPALQPYSHIQNTPTPRYPRQISPYLCFAAGT